MSSVTIFIQGHGLQEYDTISKDQDVNLLSFCGYPGDVGRMAICPNGKSIDIEAINKIMACYKSPNTQDEIYKTLETPLEKLYRNCGIKFRKGGFNYTFPKYQRYFQLKPNPHENCRVCEEYGQGRCLNLRERDRYCPEYGITVVKSSNDQDYSYTLVSKNEDTRSRANLDINEASRNYWHKKATNNAPALSEKLEQIFNDIYVEQYVSLTDLITYFRAMGFRTIYIIDPTCRSLEESSKLKNAGVAVIERMNPTKQNAFSSLVQQAQQMDRTGAELKPQCGKGWIQQCIEGICNCLKQKTDGGTKKANKRNFKKYKSKKQKSRKTKTRKQKRL